MEEINEEVNPFSMLENEEFEDDNLDYQQIDTMPTDEIKTEEFEDDVSDETEASVILNEYISQGLIDFDGDVKKDLTGAELMDILNRSAEQNNLRKLESEGYNEDVKKAIMFLRDGGSLSDLETLYSVTNFSELDISDDVDLSNRETLVKEYHRRKGVSEKKIEALWNLSIQSDETYEDAIEAQEYFKEFEDKIISEKRQEQMAIEENKRKQEEESRKFVRETLANGELLGFSISKQDANNLNSGLYEETETFEYVDESGAKKKARATKYQIGLHKYEQNREWQLMFAYLIMNDFDFSKLVTKARIQGGNETLDFLNGRRKAIKRQTNTYNQGTKHNPVNVQEFSI